ncbi:MAG TPA: biotin/lipoate A/B protein ligase family protein [Urbifossiella sp.]
MEVTPAIRLLPFAEADGATNMAADEAMLETASELGVASLRFYTWSEPTLSLGYFQPMSCRAGAENPLVPELRALPWLRRSTGGAAIVHHHELTYAFALPAGKIWHSRESWICRFHHLLRDILAEAGVAARAVECGEERKLGEVLCFLHQTPGDLLIDGSKVAGSAQRKRKGALLQHGSILLSRSEFARMLPGINDMITSPQRQQGHPYPSLTLRAGKSELFTPQVLAELLAARFSTDPGGWTAEEILRIAAIREEKYANAEWNEKR